jgi:ribosomal protein S18 acetylase RimI-like enzyme
MKVEEAIQIIEFEPSLASYFTNLNLAWIKKYFVVETRDEQVLSNPIKFIINKGGHVFFATINDEVAGTFALIRDRDDVFELSKMAVSEEFQGKKIGNKMLEFCLAKARQLGAAKVILYSNTILQPAVHLYKKYGFKEVPLEHSDYRRSNIKMEVDIKSS